MKFPSNDELQNLINHYHNGRYNEAETLALSLTQDFPEHQLSWKVLGILFSQAGRKAEALCATQKAVELEPKDAEAQYNLGNIFQLVGKLDEAIVSYRQAVLLKPDYYQAHYNLGVKLEEKGELKSGVYSQEEEMSQSHPTARMLPFVLESTKIKSNNLIFDKKPKIERKT